MLYVPTLNISSPKKFKKKGSYSKTEPTTVNNDAADVVDFADLATTPMMVDKCNTYILSFI